MPIYEYETPDRRRVERLHPYPPPRSIRVDGEECALVPSAAAFVVQDGTERFHSDTRQMEPGWKDDVKRNKKYRQEKEDRDRKKELEKIFPDVLDETGVSASD